MKIIKAKYFSTMTDKDLKVCLRLATSIYCPDYATLANSIQFKTSSDKNVQNCFVPFMFMQTKHILNMNYTQYVCIFIVSRAYPGFSRCCPTTGNANLNHIITFDDTAVVVLISKNDEAAYREEVRRLTYWRLNQQPVISPLWALPAPRGDSTATAVYLLPAETHILPLILTIFFRGTI